MTLDQEDLTAIAAEVVRQLDLTTLASALAPLIVQQLRANESRNHDAQFLASLPEEELKRRMRDIRRAEVAAMKTSETK